MDSRSFANLTLGKTGQLAQGPLPRARPLSRPSARTLAARPIVARRSRDYRLVNTVNLNVTGWDNFPVISTTPPSVFWWWTAF